MHERAIAAAAPVFDLSAEFGQTPRDPRNNPAVGDRLAKGIKIREVCDVTGDLVTWQTNGRWLSTRRLGLWYNWARTAEVLPPSDCPWGAGRVPLQKDHGPDRDPRSKPAVGDVVQVGHERREVVCRTAGQVTYVRRRSLDGIGQMAVCGAKTVGTTPWALDCVNAEVIRKGPEPCDVLQAEKPAEKPEEPVVRLVEVKEESLRLAGDVSAREVFLGSLVQHMVDGVPYGPYLVVGMRHDDESTRIRVCRPLTPAWPGCHWGSALPSLSDEYLPWSEFEPADHDALCSLPPPGPWRVGAADAIDGMRAVRVLDADGGVVAVVACGEGDRPRLAALRAILKAGE